MIDHEVNTLKDKDKLIIVANVCVANIGIEIMRFRMIEIMNYLQSLFNDGTVKIIVMPVIVPELQKIEIFNADKCDEEILKKFNENYEKSLNLFLNKFYNIIINYKINYKVLWFLE